MPSPARPDKSDHSSCPHPTKHRLRATDQTAFGPKPTNKHRQPAFGPNMTNKHRQMPEWAVTDHNSGRYYKHDVMCFQESSNHVHAFLRCDATRTDTPHTAQRLGEPVRIERALVSIRRRKVTIVALTVWLCGCSTRVTFPPDCDNPDRALPCDADCMVLHRSPASLFITALPKP
jgi:hypothetical protein